MHGSVPRFGSRAFDPARRGRRGQDGQRGDGGWPPSSRHANVSSGRQRAGLFALASFVLGLVSGAILVWVSGVSRTDISDRQEEMRKQAEARLENMPPNRRKLMVAIPIIIMIALAAATMLSSFD